ncbi:MAG: type III polyketide synthase [Asgard group archaeon]|nr:type III polyketide synthase [Asgard group archaeon]
MKKNKVYLHSIATTVPETYYTQKFALKYMKKIVADTPYKKIFLNKVYKGTEIRKRHTIIDDYGKKPSEFTFYPKNKTLRPEPTTKQRNDLYAKEALRLGKQAVEKLFNANPGFDKNKITHILTVTCTGFDAPGLDYYIVKDFELNPKMNRYILGFMGCQAAINALKLAEDLCLSNPEARVLIVNVELCSVHLQQIWELDQVIANAIFADGISAALVSSVENDCDGNKFVLHDFTTNIVQGTEEDMAWNIGNTGFGMKLTVNVPRVVKANLASILGELLDKTNRTKDEIKIWAIHPGGKTILTKAEQALDLTSEDLDSSYHIMREYGNMSSATIMFVLEHILRDTTKKGFTFATSFGPGMTIEAALLEKI